MFNYLFSGIIHPERVNFSIKGKRQFRVEHPDFCIKGKSELEIKNSKITVEFLIEIFLRKLNPFLNQIDTENILRLPVTKESQL